jgi:Tripartite tricarboxylate transporter family receptor
VPDLLAGRVTMSFANVANVAPLVKEGKLRGFAVSSRKRSVVAPDLPTMIELGYPDFEAVPWFGLMAPAGTSSAFRADMSSVGEQELLRPKIRRRPPVPGVPPTIPTANRKHGQMEFPIPSGALDALPFAMHVVKDARTEHRKSAEQGTRFSAYKPSAWRNPTRWRSICPFRYTTSPSP